jgi:hypothetical protein
MVQPVDLLHGWLGWVLLGMASGPHFYGFLA